jgi:hypothetical protein
MAALIKNLFCLTIIQNLISRIFLFFGLLSVLFSTSSVVVGQTIKEEKFVLIGDIEQWITINGNDINNPLMLLLHGGPSSLFSPFADVIFEKWKMILNFFKPLINIQ